MLVITGVSSIVTRSFQSILYTVTSSLRSIFMNLYFHEPVALYEGLLMKVVGIPLIVYHTDFTMVFRHKHVNIAVQRITVVSTTDYLAYTPGLASHVVKFRKIIEVMQSVNT